jgi:hypothetical protein
MALFGPQKNENYPRKWKDISLDFKLMFVYHGCMMVLFATGGAFSSRQEIVFTGALLAVLVSISLKHRRSTNWRWQGIKSKDLLIAFGGVGLMGIFLYAATPLFSPSNSRFLPWYLAGFGIGTFNVLQTLRLVQPSEAAFLADCHEPVTQIEPAPSTASVGPRWQRVARGAYSTLFLIVWLGFIAFFYYSGATFRDGSPVPTATQSEPVTQHGKTVYVAPYKKNLSDKLELFAFVVGIPSVIVIGLLFHFVLGVKLYPNTPTLSELLTRNARRCANGHTITLDASFCTRCGQPPMHH